MIRIVKMFISRYFHLGLSIAFGIAAMFFSQTTLSEENDMDSVKRLISNRNYLFGVFVYSKTFGRFSSDFPALANNCKKYGFNCVYLCVKRKEFRLLKNYRNNIGNAVEEFHKQNINVNALVFNDAVPFFDLRGAADEIKAIVDYNSTVDTVRKFDGVTSDLEPNSLKTDRVRFPSNFTLRWSRKGGNDNDKIMNIMLDILKKAKKEMESTSLSLSQTISPSFTKDVSKKKLTVGNINDFSQVCSYLIEMAYFDTAKKVYNAVKTDLKTSRYEKSVVVCVKIKNGDASDSFGSMTKSEFAKALSYLIKKALPYSSFKGIAIYDYEGIENIFTNE